MVRCHCLDNTALVRVMKYPWDFNASFWMFHDSLAQTGLVLSLSRLETRQGLPSCLYQHLSSSDLDSNGHTTHTPQSRAVKIRGISNISWVPLFPSFR